MNLIIRWFANALALLGIAYYLPGVGVSGFYTALIAALILGLLNAGIKPFVVLLTLPINILTLGLFTFIINALLFWFVGTIVKGFTVSGFLPAFYGALIMTLVNWLLNSVLKK